MKGWLCALVLLAASALPSLASSRSQRVHGGMVFNTSGCLHCHRINGVGGHKGPDLSGVGKTMKKSAIRKQILQGGEEMPPFREVLEPRDVKDLVAYLHSCRLRSVKTMSASGSN